ncbi:MAG: hypothetical protein IPK82_29195 [Polyangiaceae bacterium]|nr:hypothetical protein [Polyangiaceae bacterium]
MTIPKLLHRLIRAWLSSATDRYRTVSRPRRRMFLGATTSVCSLLLVVLALTRPSSIGTPPDAVHPTSLNPNATYIFPTQRGYTVLFESRPDVYSLVELDAQGKAPSPSRKIQVSDSVSAARIGERLFIAFGRNRNRDEDAEPFMDDLSVWRYSPANGELVETFLLAKQAVHHEAGPKILTWKDGTFSVLWGTFNGVIAARDFDVNGAPVGSTRRSPPHGDNSAMFEVAPLGDTHLGVLAVRKASSGSVALLLFAGLDRSNFPAPRVLVDDIGNGWGQLAMAVVPGARESGVVWQSAGKTRLWFARVNESGFVDKPLLVQESTSTIMIHTFAAGSDGFQLTWGGFLIGMKTASFSPDGRLLGPPQTARGTVFRPAVAWNGKHWFFAESTARDSFCSLHTGRLTADMGDVIERHCAF